MNGSEVVAVDYSVAVAVARPLLHVPLDSGLGTFAIEGTFNVVTAGFACVRPVGP